MKASILVLLGICVSTCGSTLERSVPSHYSPGVPVVLTLAVSPDSDTLVYAVEESVPQGWSVTSLSHAGVFDPVQRRIKWGPFVDAAALTRTLTCKLTPGPGATGPVTFSGSGYFNAIEVRTAGVPGADRFPGTLVRALPPWYVPAQPIPVSLTTQPAPDVAAYTVEEQVPEGWDVAGISHDGEWDARTGRVKWGPFIESPPVERILSYSLTAPPSSDPAEARLAGRAMFNEVEVRPAGPSLLQPQPTIVEPTVPATYEPGTNLSVRLRIMPAPWVRSWSIEQAVPHSWTVLQASHGGVFDPGTQQIKWGPFTDALPGEHVLTAILRPPSAADGEVNLGGQGFFDRVEVNFDGPSRRRRNHETSAIVSSLPPEYEPGVAMLVSLEVTPRDGVEVFSVEDTLPPGWTAVPGGISDGGIYDARNRRVKWGPYFTPDVHPRTLTYEALPPSHVIGEVTFVGRGEFSTIPVAITGDRTTLAGPGRVVRSMNSRYSAGTEFEITLEAMPGGVTDAFAIEEGVPAGWEFGSATEGGVFDPVTRRIKWGPFLDRTSRTLAYRIKPPVTPERTASFAGMAVFNLEVVPITGMTSATLNHGPMAIPDSAGRSGDGIFKISAIKLTLNDSDPDGDLPRVIAVDALSANGAPLRLEWPWIFYTPFPGDTRSDRFNYTITDGQGGTASAFVTITLNPPDNTPQNIIRIEALPGGAKRIVFAGVPGFTYHVEASEDLVTWAHLGDRTAAVNGSFEYVDTDAGVFPARFYRSTWP